MKHERPLITNLAGVPDEEILTMDDVAATLRFSRSKASEYCSTGRIRGAFRIGNQIRIQAGDLRKKIAEEKLPKNLDLYNIWEGLSSRRQHPQRNVTDGRLRMTVAQLVAKLQRLPQNDELSVGGTLVDAVAPASRN